VYTQVKLVYITSKISVYTQVKLVYILLVKLMCILVNWCVGLASPTASTPCTTSQEKLKATSKRWEYKTLLWLVGADTLYIRCLAKGVHRQLLQDTVGPAVGRRDLAR
jgi:hypothetical protein